MNVGVFLPNWIGDVAMATPTLRALRDRFREARMVGILRPYVADVLSGTHFFDQLVLHDPRSPEASLRGLRFWQRLRRERLDTAVLLTNTWRSAWWAFAAGARSRVGYARRGRQILLTHSLEPARDGRRLRPAPVLDSYLELAMLMGCQVASRKIELATTPDDERAADECWRRLGLKVGTRVVALNSGGAYGAAKLWPTPYFAMLARRIVEIEGHSVLVLCGPSERELARQIAKQAGHPRVVSLAGEELNIGLTKACVKECSLLVTTDSGPRHFAAAFNIPVITLFGPTDPRWSENHHPRAVHLWHSVECGPCQKRVCPLAHHRCMRDLSVDTVYGAVAQQLEQLTHARAA